MAAPVTSMRGPVVGNHLDNGYQTLISFSSLVALAVFEQTVQPPSIDGGDPIETTNMLNLTYITKAANCLQMWDDVSVVGSYDPKHLVDIQTLINKPTAITIHWPEGSTLIFFGYLRKAEFSPLTKGVQPTCTMTIVVTNFDPINCIEAGPIMTVGTGSCHC